MTKQHDNRVVLLTERFWAANRTIDSPMTALAAATYMNGVRDSLQRIWTPRTFERVWNDPVSLTARRLFQNKVAEQFPSFHEFDSMSAM